MKPADIPAGMRLKEAAGWNQTAQDWENVLALDPGGCWVYETDGVVAGSTTAVRYGQDLAWIGMVLVLPEYRGRGIARKLMQHALRFLEESRVACVKLDATDMGKPLYEQLGFVDELVIERWAGPAEVREPGDSHPSPVALGDVVEIGALDRAAFGADRMSLLARLAECFSGDAFRTPGGYVMGRPGAKEHYLGPLVAESPVEAQRLLAGFLKQHAGQPVFWDLLPANEQAVALAEAFGFERKRRLVRMLLDGSECQPGNVQHVFATAGFEYG